MSEALQYLADEKARKTAVVLPITDYEKLLNFVGCFAIAASTRLNPRATRLSPHGYLGSPANNIIKVTPGNSNSNGFGNRTGMMFASFSD